LTPEATTSAPETTAPEKSPTPSQPATARQLPANAEWPAEAELRAMERFAKTVLDSGMAPKDATLASLVVRLQFGRELGLAPMQAIQGVADINGHPGLWGDTLLAVCKASPVFDHTQFKEWFENTPYDENYTAVCQARRTVRGAPVIVQRFSVKQAKTARLWDRQSGSGKPMPWKTHPDRMLQMKARAFCLRDAFPDITKGLYTAEELQGIDEIMDGIDLEANAEALRAAVEPMPVTPAREPPNCEVLRAKCREIVKAIGKEAALTALAPVGVAEFGGLAVDDAKLLTDALEALEREQLRLKQVEKDAAQDGNGKPAEEPPPGKLFKDGKAGESL
jgi:hypothetical protein